MIFSVKIPTLWIFKGFLLFWGLFQVFINISQILTNCMQPQENHTHMTQAMLWLTKSCHNTTAITKHCFCLRIYIPIVSWNFLILQPISWYEWPRCNRDRRSVKPPSPKRVQKPLDCNSRVCKCFLLECSEPTEIWIVTRWWKSINLLGKAPFKSQPWCFKYWTYVCPFHSHLHW